MMNKERLIETKSQEVGISPEAYMRIVKITVMSRASDIQDLEHLLAVRDFAKIHSIAHMLKGIFGNLRLTELFELSQEIDELAKKQEDLLRMKELSEKIRESFEMLKKEFEE